MTDDDYTIPPTPEPLAKADALAHDPIQPKKIAVDPEEMARFERNKKRDQDQSARIKAANKSQSDRIRAINDPQARVKRVQAAEARRNGTALPQQSSQQSSPAPDPNAPPKPFDPYDPTTSQATQVPAARVVPDPELIPKVSIFFAKKGASSDKQFTEWVRSNSAWTAGQTRTRRECNDDASPAALIDPTDDDIVLVAMGDDITGGKKHQFFVKVAGGGSGLQILPVSKDGGSAGDQSTRCSFTYTIRSLDLSTVLGTNVPLSSNGQRVLKATMQEGSSGLVQKENGLIRLYWVDEVFEQADCSTSDTFASP